MALCLLVFLSGFGTGSSAVLGLSSVVLVGTVRVSWQWFWQVWLMWWTKKLLFLYFTSYVALPLLGRV